MSFRDALPADVKMALACQPSNLSAPGQESEPRRTREPSTMSEPSGTREPLTMSEPTAKKASRRRSESSSTRAPITKSAKRREPKWRAESKILAGRERGRPAKWGFVCMECHHPVDEHLRGEHGPGCTKNKFNSSLLEGAEEFAHLVK